MALDTSIFDNLQTNIDSNADTARTFGQLILPFDGNQGYPFTSRFDYDRGEIWLTELPGTGNEDHRIALCIGKKSNPDQTSSSAYSKGLIRVDLETIVNYFENFGSVTIDGVAYTEPADVFQKMLEKFKVIEYTGDGQSIKVNAQSVISLKSDAGLDNLITISENGVKVAKPVLSIESSNSVNIDEASTFKVTITSGDAVTAQTFTITADNVKVEGGKSLQAKLNELKGEIDNNKLIVDETTNKGVILSEKNGLLKGEIALANKSGLAFDENGRLKTDIDAHTFDVGTLDTGNSKSYTLHEALVLHKEELVRDGQNGISLSDEVRSKLDDIERKQDKFNTDDYLQLKNGVLGVTTYLKERLQHLSGTPGQITINNDMIGLDPAITTKFATIENTLSQKASTDDVASLRTTVAQKPDNTDLYQLETRIGTRLDNYVKDSTFSTFNANTTNQISGINDKLVLKADSSKVDSLTETVSELKSEMGTMSFGFEEGTNNLVLTHGTKASQKISVDLSRFVAKGIISEAKFVGNEILLVFDNGKTISIPISNLLSNVTDEVASVKSDVQKVQNTMTTLETTLKKSMSDQDTNLTTKMNNIEVKMTENDLEFDDDTEKLAVKINGLVYKTDIPVFKLEQKDSSIEIVQDSNNNSMKKINVQIASGKNALSCNANGLYVAPSSDQEITLLNGTTNSLQNILNSLQASIDKINEKLNQLPVYRFTAPLVESAVDKSGNATISLKVDNEAITIKDGALTVGTVDANIE